MIPIVQMVRYEELKYNCDHGYCSLSDTALCATSTHGELRPEATDDVAFHLLVSAELLNPFQTRVHFLQLSLSCRLCLFAPTPEASLNVMDGTAR